MSQLSLKQPMINLVLGDQKKRISIVLAIVSLAILFLPSQAKATNESQAAALFLLIDPGARSSGLGKAYTAIANDATGAYYNPAGIAGTKLICGELYYIKWLPALVDDVNYSHLSGVLGTNGFLNLGLAAFGLSLSYFDCGEQIRTNEYGEEEGSFHSYDCALTATYADNVNRNLSLGASLKFIYSHLADVGAGQERGKGTGKAFAADIGLLYQGILPTLAFYHRGDVFGTATQLLAKRMSPGISVGFSLSNIGPKMSYIDARQADPLPRNVRLGIAYNCLDTDETGLVLALDLYKPLVNDDPFYKGVLTAWGDESFSDEIDQIDVHIGGELTLFYVLSLRIGYTSDRDGELETSTFGIGLGPETFRFNYSYLPAKDTPLQDSHRWSLSLSF
ncbi:MAG: PorV/PorQ family protein [Candidatus Latescibacteria bacterium]|nr:PorV/PorQ family protein [Candidatus Latescibacterota bacterium]